MPAVSQHTPTPWSADNANGEGCFGIFAANGEPLAMLAEVEKRRGSLALYDTVSLPRDPDWKPYEFDNDRRYAKQAEHEANAAFIVTACNAHDELVAELRKLYRAYVSLLALGRDRIITLGGACDAVEVMEEGDPALVSARAAIAKAEAAQ